MLSLVRRGAHRWLVPGATGQRLPDSSVARCFTLQTQHFGTAELPTLDPDNEGEAWGAGRWGAGRALGSAQLLAIPGDASGVLRPVALSLDQVSNIRLKVAEVLRGLAQSTAVLFQPRMSPAGAFGRTLPFHFPGLGGWAMLPLSPKKCVGYEDRGGAKFGEEGHWGELFEGGVWATSVKRKRVTKMRKHKWRKRRKIERQSAARRSN